MATSANQGLTDSRIEALGLELYQALRGRHVLAPLTEREPEITIENAYHISKRMVQLRLDRDGEKIVGKKIGVTSDAVQKMLGVYQPDFGFLTNTMAFANDAAIRIPGQLIQPRAEGEIAFRLKKDLRGPGVTAAQVLDATEAIIPCFEIVDSRIRDWKIKIQDTVADNASCGVYVLGREELDPRSLDLPNLEIDVFKNGTRISSGKGAAVQGNPLTAVAWLANTLGQFDIPFLAGEVILSGSLVPLEPVKAGDKMHLDLKAPDGSKLGSVTCSFTN
jgi:2-oxopent-4-enoate/cis-2-oxohex-4-enoate hydratase